MPPRVVDMTGPQVVDVTSPDAIERFARRDIGLHIYELGDLDPAFWPRTRWWGLAGDDGELVALALLYDGGETSTLLALARDDGGAGGELLAAIGDRLPDRVHAHLGPGMVGRLVPAFAVDHHGPHRKMLLGDPAALAGVATEDVVRLGEADLPELLALYRRAYPGNWFDPRMLATGQYFGLHDGGQLRCVAGVHVHSPRHGVAALGNVTTDPDHRGRGLARRTTARLCRSLLDEGVTAIGLNVRADNAAAIRCYQRLGFAIVADYDEVTLVRCPAG